MLPPARGGWAGRGSCDQASITRSSATTNTRSPVVRTIGAVPVKSPNAGKMPHHSPNQKQGRRSDSFALCDERGH
jgi:hypothetical protein